MKRISAISLLGLCLPLCVAAADRTQYRGTLIGNTEVPSVSTRASGTFRAYVAGDGLHWELTYKNIEGGAVTQAHIHLGERHTTGGIILWFCSNMPSPPTPPGVPACPTAPARIVGISNADDVVGPAGQGITAGEFDALVKALGNGTSYANVHTDMFGGGEIRAVITRVAP